MEESWQEFIKGVDETSQKMEKGKTNWISGENWQRIQERSKLKTKLNAARSERIKDGLRIEYRKMDREVKYGLRSEKRGYVDS